MKVDGPQPSFHLGRTSFDSYGFSSDKERIQKGSYLIHLGSYLFWFVAYIFALGSYLTQIGSYLFVFDKEETELGSYLIPLHAYLKGKGKMRFRSLRLFFLQSPS